jgi:peptidoglycan/LPS O-acetylase OafA/YrhL
MRLTNSQSKYFDAWRGFLALVVAFAHMFQIYSSQFEISIVKITGAFAGAAVCGFFVLSGFFIQKSLERCSNDGEVDWASYLVSRADRILPPFVFGLALTVFLYFSSFFAFTSRSNIFIAPSDRTGFYLTGFLDSAFFADVITRNTLSANGPLWSLSVEVWCYIFALLFVLHGNGNRLGLLCLPFAIIAVALNPMLIPYGALWVLGYVISILHSESVLFKYNYKLLHSFLSFLLIAIFLGMFFFPMPIASKACVLFQFVFTIKVLQKDNVSSFRFFETSGKFSYTLYVTHFPVILFFYGVSSHSYIIAYVFSVLLAAAFGFIETINPVKIVLQKTGKQCNIG